MSSSAEIGLVGQETEVTAKARRRQFSARDSGALAGLAPRKRGPAAKVPHPLEQKVLELQRENTRLQRRAERAEGLVELQKKVSELLGIQLPKPDEEK